MSDTKYEYVREDGMVCSILPHGWVEMKSTLREIALGSTIVFPGTINREKLIGDLSVMGWHTYRMFGNGLLISDTKADVLITLQTTDGQTKVKFNVALPDWAALIEEIAKLEKRAGVKRLLAVVEQEDHALDLLLGVVEFMRIVTEPYELIVLMEI